jgi:hypothetical protein
MGRKKINNAKTINYTLRLSVDENKILNEKEIGTGLKRSQLIRKLIINGEVKIIRIEQSERMLLSNLLKIGVNLNQAVKLSHQTAGAKLYWVQEEINKIKTITDKYFNQ